MHVDAHASILYTVVMSEPRRVWVVDDSDADASRARQALALDYDVETFADGAAVIERAATHPPADVIVLDWVMPGVTGLDVCRFLRASGGERARVGILLLSGHRESADVVEGLEAGANDYLTKPYADDELRARVGSLVRSRGLLERVEQSEDSVRTLLTQSPDALVVLDAHGKLTFANPEAEHVLGNSTAALLGRPLTELVPDLQLSRVREANGRVCALPDVTIGDRVFAPVARLLSADFAAAATVALRDVTEQRRLESRRLDFYSIIAHDLRSPLAAMLLRTDLILNGQRGVLSAELTADMRKMERNMRSMVSLINDFLDMARLEGSAYQLQREHVDTSSLVASVVDDIRPLLDESGLAIDVDVPPEALMVAGDRPRLVQVVTNLLSNAVKFTPRGGLIGVTVTRGGRNVILRVSDTGRGIAPDLVPHLFQRYSRATGPGPGSGSGLGLMIVREIVEAHGGTVSVESELGRGTTFTVRLPQRAPSAGKQILVVDDDVDMRESLQFLFESQGYTVDTAQNGLEALERLQAGQVPDVMVLDLSMPVMTGVELLARLGDDARWARLPVCVMSADLSVLPAAPVGSLVMQKPMQVDRVLEFMARHVRRLETTRTAQAAL